MEDLRNLAPFMQAAQSASFSIAASKLGLTPAAVSKSVARLEKLSGTRLFNRTTRKLQLTAEGRRFYERISASLASLDDAFVELSQAHREAVGLIRVTTIKAFGRRFL